MTRREIHNWFAERRKKVAAKRKKEEAEMDEEALGLEEDFGVKKEERQNENTSKVEGNIEDRDDTEPKVNPIKINLKMLKVTGHGKGEPEVGHHTDNNKVSNVPHTTQYRGKKTHEQLHLLKQVFARTRWPSSLQYNELMAKTGLPRTDVVRWFGDSRYVLKNGQLKWLESYQVLVDNEDFQKADTSILKEHLEAHGSLDETKLDEVAKSTGFEVNRQKDMQFPLKPIQYHSIQILMRWLWSNQKPT
ncbi:hypothetical protein DNTS_009951 [Danionella cerebrum]|uniref:Homeobox domain-containing protein n=1 Tax=Danionella cerebrum TaxID=2873325 RepID=A0A553N453_9TELE|nr:hypothetical protein DNTS_009951 [Danionella translucida]